MRRALLVLIPFLIAPPTRGQENTVDLPPALSPAASLKCLKARLGFQVELVAAEPLVQDPIAFAWGPDGKFWVVEMGDYPLGTDGRGKAGGRVKVLSDRDE